MNRSMRFGTIAAAVAGGIVAAAWLIKTRFFKSAPVPVSEQPRYEFAPAPPPVPVPEDADCDDDLSVIAGIGPVFKARLAEAGITSFAILSRVDAIQIADQIQAPVSRIQAWVDAARRLRS